MSGSEKHQRASSGRVALGGRARLVRDLLDRDERERERNRKRQKERKEKNENERERRESSRGESQNTMVDTVNPRCRFDFIATLTPSSGAPDSSRSRVRP